MVIFLSAVALGGICISTTAASPKDIIRNSVLAERSITALSKMEHNAGTARQPNQNHIWRRLGSITTVPFRQKR